MTSPALPPELVARFRGIALERLERVESRWAELLRGEGEPDLSIEVQQELHTLKGEAKMMGFAGVATLCHALEGLVSAAEARSFSVPEDVDLVATMAIRFMVVLLRKKDASPGAGMDVDGFVRQIEEVMAELPPVTPSRTFEPRISQRPAAIVEGPDRISRATQQRLAEAAARAFLEHLAARRARPRLFAVYAGLRDTLVSLSAVPLDARLVRHEEAARALANDLGKQIDVVFEAGEVRARADVVEALEVAVLHTLRNAIDHGIEPPEARCGAGKSAQGTVRVSARQIEDVVEVRVEDDGAGVDLEAVRARAIDLGIVAEDRAATMLPEALGELVFRPGLSTRTEVTDVSGRGIGLDAVRAAIARVGGRISVSTRAGAGTAVVVRVPQPGCRIPVVCFEARGADVLFAVAGGAGTLVGPEAEAEAADPMDLLDIAAPFDAASGEGTRVAVVRGLERFVFHAGGPPRQSVADRVCPTSDDCPVEIVMIDEIEAVLLRPECLRE
ncbi:ATP-binding protein [Polyangium aurulentum]|uniref:ATP-binding protein n=1 Tax=Polyangium aurulentum TaxID=2567896 RepID=UPI00146C05BC|nr:ATP-binding protein [Polyangium aurulentum]UQA59340.1 Hpt domain-containing protein [Polyangium aurulentum]